MQTTIERLRQLVMEEKEIFHNPKDYCQVWHTLSVRCISTLSLLCFERTFLMNINQQKTGNMEKGFQRQVTPEQMEKIKAQVIRLTQLQRQKLFSINFRPVFHACVVQPVESQ